MVLVGEILLVKNAEKLSKNNAKNFFRKIPYRYRGILKNTDFT